jgi:hypothetical protein
MTEARERAALGRPFLLSKGWAAIEYRMRNLSTSENLLVWLPLMRVLRRTIPPLELDERAFHEQ